MLARIQEYLPILELSMLAYCLLPNHYHFLVRQDGEHRAGLMPQRVFNSYSKAYNKRYWHFGTLFEGNYKVNPVADSTYLLHLCRYIHGNPIRYGLADHPAEWPFSNYHEWIKRLRESMADPELVQNYFPTPALYHDFVMDDLARNPPLQSKQ